MASRQSIGRWGEKLASEHLKRNGYEVLEANARTPHGEIDLVARHGEVIVFVEVKTRRNDGFGMPEEAITPQKREHLLNAAQAYLQLHPEVEGDWRVDVIAIRCLPGEAQPQITWYENAIG